MEDVGSDDLVRSKREDDEQRQPEEHAASDRRQPDDEAAEEPDDDGGEAVAVRQLPVRVAGRPAVCTTLFAMRPTAPKKAPHRAPAPSPTSPRRRSAWSAARSARRRRARLAPSRPASSRRAGRGRPHPPVLNRADGLEPAPCAMSVPIAVDGGMPKRKTRIGVMSEPPPIPVIPTRRPVRSPATVSFQSPGASCPSRDMRRSAPWRPRAA